MSKYEDQYDDCDVICPYCKATYQMEGEDYNEDSRPETCGDCGKKYHLAQSFSVTNETEPDCELNNLEHDYEWLSTSSGGAWFCKICGKCNGTKKAKQ